jgi:hypothetical protein
MPTTIISKTYNVVAPIINAVSSFLPVVCGVPESALTGISDRYILEITANLGGDVIGLGPGQSEFVIHAYLQDKVVLNASSSWQGIMDSFPGGAEAGALIKLADTATQVATGFSAISTVSTQRKWVGSDPITIQLRLKFEAVNNVENEVLTPCRVLQGLTLPRAGLKNNVIGLIPPGPSPFTLDQKVIPRGEQITINIGNFIGFGSVIVKNVKVTYENRMSYSGPIGAEVDLTIETFRMLTRGELESAYLQKMQVSGTNKIGIVG